MVEVDGENKRTARDAGHLEYFVVPNEQFIERSTKYFSKLFNNENYAKMLGSLSEEILKYYWDNLETEEEVSAKMLFMEDIERAIRRRKDWRFKLFPSGSSMTRLASKGSDLDVAFWCPDARQFFQNESDAAFHFLQWIRHILFTDPQIMNDIDHIQYVEAKVPVLRIKCKTGLEVDLSSCTESFVSGIQNSYLIRGFVSWDRRFAPLVMLVKEWASRSDVKNPNLGGFNSYAMVLLVVHFLQCGVSPPVLPNLQNLFPEMEKNTMNVAQLFMLFLDYYSKFDFKTRYICLREAAVKWRDGREGSEAISEQFSVFIRDPMDDHNPGRTVRDVAYLQRKMKIALELFTSSQRFPKLSEILSPM